MSNISESDDKGEFWQIYQFCIIQKILLKWFSHLALLFQSCYLLCSKLGVHFLDEPLNVLHLEIVHEY